MSAKLAEALPGSDVEVGILTVPSPLSAPPLPLSLARFADLALADLAAAISIDAPFAPPTRRRRRTPQAAPQRACSPAAHAFPPAA